MDSLLFAFFLRFFLNGSTPRFHSMILITLEDMFMHFFEFEFVFLCFGFLCSFIYGYIYIYVSKNRGKTTKMDVENNGSKPYEQMDDWGFSHHFWKHPYDSSIF